MVAPVNSDAFFVGFQAYLQSRRISQEDINSLIAAYKEIDADAVLSQHLRAMKCAEIDENISFPQLVYIYLNAILHRDIERAETCWHRWSDHQEVEDDDELCRYSRMRLALAYDSEAKTFATDNLLVNLAKLINGQKYMYLFVVDHIFSPTTCPRYGENEHVFNDYQIENAINLIKAVLAEEAKYLLPTTDSTILDYFSRLLTLVFSYFIQDDKTYDFGLLLLTKYVAPEEILRRAGRPSNNDYRLLNHCVELLVQKNPDIDFNGISRKCNPLVHNLLLNDIPAAMFLIHTSSDDIKAAKLGYKPAMAYCLRRSYRYADDISDCLNDVFALWQQKYLSTYEALSAIAIFGVKHDERDLGEYSDIDRVYGLSFKPAVHIPCLDLRFTLLGNLCEANRLSLLSRRIQGRKHDEFSVLYQTAKSLLNLRKSKFKNLQAWIDTPFGHLIITRYMQHCLKLETLAELRKFAEKVIDHLVLCDPRKINLWQLELLYKHLSSAMPLDKEVADAYEDFKNTLKDKPKEKREVNALASSMDVVRLILAHLLIEELLRLRVRGVNRHFRSVVDERLFAGLNNYQITDFKNIRGFNHVFYIACQSGNSAFINAALRRIKKETFSDVYQIAVEAGQLDSVKHLEEERMEFSLNESERSSSHLSGLRYGRVHIAEYFLRQANYQSSYRYELGLYLSVCYFNALLSERMTKEMHQQWLIVVQKLLIEKPKNEIEFVLPVAILCQDWQLLRLLLRNNAKCFHLLAEQDKSVMSGTSCVVTASAPQWWQDEQRECLEQLRIEKQQWVKLCQALLQDLEVSVMRPLQTITLFFADNNTDHLRKNFVYHLRSLLKYLSENKIDVNSAIVQLAELIEKYRELEQINTFFKLPAKCSFVQIVRCIENCLQRYSSDELTASTSANRNESSYNNSPLIGFFGDLLDRVDRVNSAPQPDPHRLAPPAPDAIEEEAQPAKMPARAA